MDGNWADAPGVLLLEACGFHLSALLTEEATLKCGTLHRPCAVTVYIDAIQKSGASRQEECSGRCRENGSVERRLNPEGDRHRSCKGEQQYSTEKCSRACLPAEQQEHGEGGLGNGGYDSHRGNDGSGQEPEQFCSVADKARPIAPCNVGLSK